MSCVTIIWSMVASAWRKAVRRHCLVGRKNADAGFRLAVAICFLLAFEIHAARSTFRSDPDYLIDTWETEEGLPENSATAMVQTRDGYLWFGTFNGLVRFDGLKFTVFNRANTPELPSVGIVNLHVDQRGWLWVSTLQGMAVLADNKWRAFGTNEGWAGDYVRTFAERRNGDLLLTTFDGKVLEFSNGRLSQLPEPPGEPGKGYQGQVDEMGQWWVAQHHFVGRWDGRSWVQMLTAPNTNAAIDKVGFTAARDGGMWLFLTNVLHRYQSGIEVSCLEFPEPLAGLWSMSEDSRSNLWICTTDNGIRQVSTTGEVRRWTTTNGLSSDSTRFVFEDHESNLWVGTSGGGLQRFKPKRFHSFQSEGRSLPQVASSVCANAAGGVWVATYGQGLFRRSASGVTKVVLPLENEVEVTRFTQSVLEDRLARVWIGTYKRGLWLLEKQGPHMISAMDAGGDNVTALFEDSRGRVWMAGGQAASVYDGGGFRVFGPQEGLPRGPISCFEEDSSGVVWLAHQDGVFRFERDGFALVKHETGLPLRDIACLRSDSSGAMWMGTRGDRLWRWRNGRISRIGSAAGFPVQAVHAIIDDGRGFFWMPSNLGIVRAAQKDLHAVADGVASHLECQLLDQNDGMPSAQCPAGQPTCARDGTGRLWFATQKGVAMVDPVGLRLNSLTPPVLIENLVYRVPRAGSQSGDHRTLAASDDTDVRLSPPFQEPVRLPPGSRRLEIDYTALSYSTPEKVRFQTMLEGIEHDWEDATHSRVAQFYELRPGHYLFRVRAANNDGVWNETGASLAFTVLPFVWQIWWFRAVALVALISLGGAVTWRRVHLKHCRELVELEKTRQQRMELAHVGRLAVMGQLASSLAHELNQPLGAILRNAEAAELFLRDPSPDLEEVLAILADIRQDDQRAGAVIDRMRSLLRRREIEHVLLDLNLVAGEVVNLLRSEADSRKVQVALELVSQPPLVRGDRVQLQQVLVNLLLNAMDAMNDSAPDGRQITLRVQPSGTQVEVTVSDVGHGIPVERLAKVFEPFFTSKPDGLGMGLPISRAIIEAHGGRLWAENNEGGGRRFILRCRWQGKRYEGNVE